MYIKILTFLKVFFTSVLNANYLCQMSWNSFGNILRLTTFGESHGTCIGGILDGMPSGISIDLEAIRHQLGRRRPGQSHISTDRNEEDQFQLLSGLFQGKTTGHSIGFQIQNQDQRSKDYDQIKAIYRPSHADYTYEKKYGIRDPYGSGRSSARETANWVLAGAIAKHIIPSISIHSYVSSIGNVHSKSSDSLDLDLIDSNYVRCPDLETADKMIDLVEKIKEEGDSLGGVITTVVKNMPIGIGEPIFHKLESELARAMLSINATKGFELGSGFEGTKMKGSEHNDPWISESKTKTNHSGGIQGGISNGMDLIFRTAFKPTSSIRVRQDTIDYEGRPSHIEIQGRHDPCVVPRAVPIVDAMTTLVLADLFLISKTRRSDS